MLLGSDGDGVPGGAEPQPGGLKRAARAARFGQLFGKRELHLAAVLLAECRGITAEQRPVKGLPTHHAFGASPVARACCNMALSRSTSAAAARLPAFVIR